LFTKSNKWANVVGWALGRLVGGVPVERGMVGWGGGTFESRKKRLREEVEENKRGIRGKGWQEPREEVRRKKEKSNEIN
jgi:hypothetical protein